MCIRDSLIRKLPRETLQNVLYQHMQAGTWQQDIRLLESLLHMGQLLKCDCQALISWPGHLQPRMFYVLDTLMMDLLQG